MFGMGTVYLISVIIGLINFYSKSAVDINIFERFPLQNVPRWVIIGKQSAILKQNVSNFRKI